MNGQEEAFVELESARVLHHYLPHRLHELCEHGGYLLIVRGVQETAAVRELVTKRQPFLLNQGLQQRESRKKSQSGPTAKKK
jgi:hypothetical protein